MRQLSMPTKSYSPAPRPVAHRTEFEAREYVVCVPQTTEQKTAGITKAQPIRQKFFRVGVQNFEPLNARLSMPTKSYSPAPRPVAHRTEFEAREYVVCVPQTTEQKTAEIAKAQPIRQKSFQVGFKILNSYMPDSLCRQNLTRLSPIYSSLFSPNNRR